MAAQLRGYQQKAVDEAVKWMRGSIDPFIIDAATGAGKSLIIAAIAHEIHTATGKKILCLAPSAELVTQNREKYLATGNKASMFSASAGAKELRHPVVFGSPLTVKNKISRFMKDYALVVIDEAHGITPTIKAIIDAMRDGNPNLRVCGLTATPYRLGDGYIFRMWPDGRVNTDDVCRDPYFVKSVDRIDARDLIEQGYLTPPVLGQINAETYDTHSMETNRQGKFNSADVDRAYHGHGRKTAGIVADVVAQARDRHGVMFFAATVQHAQEVMASLPPSMSAIVTAETPKAQRDSILRRFKARDLKYLVNVAVLTTGFDAPHVDVIAILRKTESVGLLQQIVGRGLRLHDGKADCLILDYTSNMEDHVPDGDLFSPVIKARKAKDEEVGLLPIICPDCGYENGFSGNSEYIDMPHDENGYLMGLDGVRIEGEFGHISVHYGRRCNGLVKVGRAGEHERCGYRWNGKPCPACDEMNDIAARYCYACKAEIVDPNEKLHADFKAMKKDPRQVQVDEVVSVNFTDQVSRAGKPMIVARWVTPYRHFTTYHMKQATSTKQLADWEKFVAATDEGSVQPRTVAYVKEQGSDFFRILGYNMEPQHEPA